MRVNLKKLVFDKNRETERRALSFFRDGVYCIGNKKIDYFI